MTYKKMLAVPPPQPPPPLARPHVYLDIEIGGDRAGRVVIELRTDVAPRTCENFRVLCTGEQRSALTGHPLHYRGTSFHKAMSMFMIQGGDISAGKGPGGESIYGHRFEDENFTLKHDGGVVSMANEGRPHSNGSQFFITTVPCPHLDGTNVVFGRVVAGFGIVLEVEKCGSGPDNAPTVDCVIADCGELFTREDWGINCSDGTADTLPEYPEDFFTADNADNIPPVTPEEAIECVTGVKDSGNHYYKLARYTMSLRKYRKCLRYLQHVQEKLIPQLERSGEHPSLLEGSRSGAESLQDVCFLNQAACELKLHKYHDAISSCDQVRESCRGKALYRRAQAQFALRNYDAALRDLRLAERRAPASGAVAALLTQVRESCRGKALYRRAQAQFALRNYDAALRDLRLAERRAPASGAVAALLTQVRESCRGKALYRRAQAQFALRNYDAALRDLRLAERRAPASGAVAALLTQVRESCRGKALYRRAQAQFALRNYDAALRDLRLAERRAPASGAVAALLTQVRESCRGKALYRRAQAQFALRNYDAALRDLRLAERRAPASGAVAALLTQVRESCRGKALYRRAQAQFALRNYDAALRDLRLAEPRAPASGAVAALLTQVRESCRGKALYRRAQAQFALRNYDAALRDLRLAERRAPASGAVAALLTQVRRARADYDRQQRQRLSKFFRA